MADVPTIAANGLNMPALGFGTFELDDETVERILPKALELGYRHIDTAQIYRNERSIGKVIGDSGLAREQLFLTTKVWIDRFEPTALLTSTRESLDKLGVEQVDLLLLHWPVFCDRGMNPVLEALMRARADGLARYIGISNFNIEQTEKAVAFCGDGMLAAAQVEYHVYLAQERLRRVLGRHNLVLTAHTPLAKARTINDPVLWSIGEKYRKTSAQVALRWLVEQDRVTAIPSTGNPHHAAANIDIFDFSLDEEDLERVAALSQNLRICEPERLAPVWDE